MKTLQVPEEWRAVINPWTQDDALARVLILRSAILWSFGHIEQRLTDMAIRCSRMDDYDGIRDKPPFTGSGRVKYLRRVLAQPGPYERYRSLGTAILDRYDATRVLRNRMAHADMQVLGPLPGGGDYPVWFEEIVVDGDGITFHRTDYWAGQLEREAVKASRFSKAIQRLHYRLFGDSRC